LKRHLRTIQIFHFYPLYIAVIGPKKDKVTGEWRRLYNKELYDLYSPPVVIWVVESRRIRWMGHVACVRDWRDDCRVLVERPEGMRPLGRRRPR
jgi:hypothetical protein